MLWQSPETLRSANQQPTQKGDIYSVGIIMQEIVTRARPFEEERSSMEIDGIVLSPLLNVLWLESLIYICHTRPRCSKRIPGRIYSLNALSATSGRAKAGVKNIQ